MYVLEESKVAVGADVVFREVFILTKGKKPESQQKIDFCPWCGTRFAESLRHEWIKRAEIILGREVGIMARFDVEKDLPKEMYSGDWWMNENIQ